MTKHFHSLVLAVLLLIFNAGKNSAQDASPAASSSIMPLPDDWITWGYDQQRSGWNQGETALTKSNVSKLKLLWSTQVSTPPTDVALSTLTAPIVVKGVKTVAGKRDLIFLLGADDTIFALDAETGNILWQKTFPNIIKPVRPGTWLCSNTANDTPTIDRQREIIFFATSDGKLRGLNLGDGTERLAPTDLVAPFARAWSLNLVNNTIYTTNARSCGEVPGQPLPRPFGARVAVQAAGAVGTSGATAAQRQYPRGPVEASISAVDVSDLDHPVASHFYTSSSRESGPWGRGGVAKTPNGIVTQTADGLYDPAGGSFGETVLEFAPKLAGLIDTFTPTNWQYMNLHDLDFGSASPVVFTFGGKTLIATACKEGVLYVLDDGALGGGPGSHSAPFFKSVQIGNDDAFGGNTKAPGQGVWGALTTYETRDGKRFLYVPMWGPLSKYAPQFKYNGGPTPNGSILAFQLNGDGDKISLAPQWSSPNMIVPDPPTVANGVVYAIQTGEQTIQNPGGARPDPSTGGAHFRATPVSNLVLYAFDAETGKQLYSSKKIITDWTHFSEPVVALGKVFLVTHDAHVYAFGLH